MDWKCRIPERQSQLLEELLGHVLGEDAPALDEPGEVPSAVVVHDDVDVVGVPREVLGVVQLYRYAYSGCYSLIVQFRRKLDSKAPSSLENI